MCDTEFQDSERQNLIKILMRKHGIPPTRRAHRELRALLWLADVESLRGLIKSADKNGGPIEIKSAFHERDRPQQISEHCMIVMPLLFRNNLQLYCRDLP